MSPPTNRNQILEAFRQEIKNGKPLVGAGAGIGLSSKFIEIGGGDMIIIYNSGRFRMNGHGSLAGLMPYSNANDVVLDMAKDVLPVVDQTPVIAGVCGTDPYKDMPRFLAQLRDMGFAVSHSEQRASIVNITSDYAADMVSKLLILLPFIQGVQNFPTVGLIDKGSIFRANLEETGMGFAKEVDMIRTAHEMGMLTTPYVFDEDDAVKMATAGAEVVVCHMGLTTSGSIGARSGKSLDDCVVDIQKIRDAAVKISPDIIVLCHGGPIATPKDAKYILEQVRGIHGFFGASSMERIPVEVAITNITKEFKGILDE